MGPEATTSLPFETNPPPMDRCPACGYSLAGLGPNGKCPECGTAFDQNVIVVFGWMRGRNANIFNSRSSWPLLLFGFGLLGTIPGLLTVVIGRDPGLVFFPLILYIPIIALGVYVRLSNDNSLPPLQLRMTRYGLVVIPSPRTASTSVNLQWIAFIVYMVCVFAAIPVFLKYDWSTAGYYILPVMLLFVVLGSVAVVRRKRIQSLRGNPEVAELIGNCLSPSLQVKKWDQISGVLAKAGKPAMTRVRFSSSEGWPSYFIDLEVQCEPEKWEFIQPRIDRWRGRA